MKLSKAQKELFKWLKSDSKTIMIMPRKFGRTYVEHLYRKYLKDEVTNQD